MTKYLVYECSFKLDFREDLQVGTRMMGASVVAPDFCRWLEEKHDRLA